MNLIRQTLKAIKRNLIIAMLPQRASFLGAALLCGTAMLFGTILLFGTVMLCGTTAQASEPTSNEQSIPNPEHTGSLTISFTDEADEPDKFGNKVGIYKVADIKVEDGFSIVYDELFESVGEPPYRDGQLNDALAQKLNETAEIKGISLDAPSEEIWSDGQATFKGTEAGLYLVVQTYRVSASEKSVIAPLLVMIPERKADGTLNYNVKISANGTSNRKPGSESQNKMLSELTPHSKLPRVGAPVLNFGAPLAGAVESCLRAGGFLLAGAALIAGVVLLAVGAILAKSGKCGHEGV